MKRLTAVGLLATLCLVSLVIAACGGGAQAEDDGINAAQAEAIEMGIDPETTGNTASTLGALESCVRVDVPGPSFDDASDYNVDVYVKGDTQALIGYDASVVYAAINDGCPAVADSEAGDNCLNSLDDDGDGKTNDGCPQVGASAESGVQCEGILGGQGDEDGDAIVHVAAPGTDSLVKMPGAVAIEDSLPDSDGSFFTGAAYLSGGQGTPGDGALVRVGLDIGGSGLVTLVLNPPPFANYESVAGAHAVTRVAARLAINQDCDGVTPTATPTATTATPTSTSTPGTPTPTPPPGTVLLVSGWNNSCYVGAEQPVQDALAGVGEHVLAAYRMRADQGFDRWFPNRPDVSTIASVSLYQSLFILTDQSATWAQQPSGTPPASASLANGWNSVCYTGETKSAEEATAGVAGGFAIMYQLASDQGWSRYVPARPDVSNLVQLSQFGAVLVLVNQEGGTSWTFDP